MASRVGEQGFGGVFRSIDEGEPDIAPRDPDACERYRAGLAPGEIVGASANDDDAPVIVTGAPRQDPILDWLKG